MNKSNSNIKPWGSFFRTIPDNNNLSSQSVGKKTDDDHDHDHHSTEYEPTYDSGTGKLLVNAHLKNTNGWLWNGNELYLDEEISVYNEVQWLKLDSSDKYNISVDFYDNTWWIAVFYDNGKNKYWAIDGDDPESPPTAQECLDLVNELVDEDTYVGYLKHYVEVDEPKLLIKSVMNLDYGAYGRVLVLEALDTITDIENYGFSIGNEGDIEQQEATLPSSVGTMNAGDQLFIIKKDNDNRVKSFFSTDDNMPNLKILETKHLENTTSMNVFNFDGNDSINLHYKNNLFDSYGVSGINGSGKDWEYRNSYAVRYDYDIYHDLFNIINWQIADLDILLGQTNYTTATLAFPFNPETEKITLEVPELSEDFPHVLQLDEAYGTRIETSDDEDWFKINLESIILQYKVSVMSSDLGMNVKLYKQNGDEKQLLDEGEVDGLNSSIEFNISTVGNYFFKVTKAEDSSTSSGVYTIIVTSQELENYVVPVNPNNGMQYRIRNFMPSNETILNEIEETMRLSGFSILQDGFEFNHLSDIQKDFVKTVLDSASTECPYMIFYLNKKFVSYSLNEGELVENYTDANQSFYMYQKNSPNETELSFGENFFVFYKYDDSLNDMYVDTSKDKFEYFTDAEGLFALPYNRLDVVGSYRIHIKDQQMGNPFYVRDSEDKLHLTGEGSPTMGIQGSELLFMSFMEGMTLNNKVEGYATNDITVEEPTTLLPQVFGSDTSLITSDINGSYTMKVDPNTFMSSGAPAEQNVYQTFTTNQGRYDLHLNVEELNLNGGVAQFFRKSFRADGSFVNEAYQVQQIESTGHAMFSASSLVGTSDIASEQIGVMIIAPIDDDDNTYTDQVHIKLSNPAKLTVRSGKEQEFLLFESQERVIATLHQHSEEGNQLDGVPLLTSDTIELINKFGVQQVALRFSNVLLNKNQTVEDVKMLFAVNQIYTPENSESGRNYFSNNDLYLNIYGEKVVNSSALEAVDGDVSNRFENVTQAIKWSPEYSNEVDDLLISVNIAPIINELTHQDEWVKGNSVTILIESERETPGKRWLHSRKLLDKFNDPRFVLTNYQLPLLLQTTIITDANIYEIVDLWLNNRELAKRKYGSIKYWDVSRVTNMNKLFSVIRNANAASFNADLSLWDVSNVKNMGAMFRGCKQFNSDISKWDVSHVEGMFMMFFDCEKFDQSLRDWNVVNVSKEMKDMFFNTGLSDENKCELTHGPHWKNNVLFKKYYLQHFKHLCPRHVIKLQDNTYDLEFRRWKDVDDASEPKFTQWFNTVVFKVEGDVITLTARRKREGLETFIERYSDLEIHTYVWNEVSKLYEDKYYKETLTAYSDNTIETTDGLVAKLRPTVVEALDIQYGKMMYRHPVDAYNSGIYQKTLWDGDSRADFGENDMRTHINRIIDNYNDGNHDIILGALDREFDVLTGYTRIPVSELARVKTYCDQYNLGVDYGINQCQFVTGNTVTEIANDVGEIIPFDIENLKVYNADRTDYILLYLFFKGVNLVGNVDSGWSMGFEDKENYENNGLFLCAYDRDEDLGSFNIDLLFGSTIVGVDFNANLDYSTWAHIEVIPSDLSVNFLNNGQNSFSINAQSRLSSLVRLGESNNIEIKNAEELNMKLNPYNNKTRIVLKEDGVIIKNILVDANYSESLNLDIDSIYSLDLTAESVIDGTNTVMTAYLLETNLDYNNKHFDLKTIPIHLKWYGNDAVEYDTVPVGNEVYFGMTGDATSQSTVKQLVSRFTMSGSKNFQFSFLLEDNNGNHGFSLFKEEAFDNYSWAYFNSVLNLFRFTTYAYKDPASDFGYLQLQQNNNGTNSGVFNYIYFEENNLAMNDWVTAEISIDTIFNRGEYKIYRGKNSTDDLLLSDSFTLDFTLTVSDKYYISLEADQEVNSPQYAKFSDFKFKKVTRPDNIRSSPRELTLNTPELDIIDVLGDKDYFYIDLTAGLPYKLELEGYENDLLNNELLPLQNPILELYDSLAEGSVPIEVDRGNDGDYDQNIKSVINFIPSTSGRYYLEAAAFSDGFTGIYQIVGILNVPEYSPANPGSLIFAGSEAQITTIIEIPGDLDYFTINLTSGEPYNIRVDPVSYLGLGPLADPDVYIYDSGFNQLRYEDGPFPDYIPNFDYVATYTGLHYFMVKSYFDSASYIGGYTLVTTKTTTEAQPLPDNVPLVDLDSNYEVNFNNGYSLTEGGSLVTTDKTWSTTNSSFDNPEGVPIYHNDFVFTLVNTGLAGDSEEVQLDYIHNNGTDSVMKVYANTTPYDFATDTGAFVVFELKHKDGKRFSVKNMRETFSGNYESILTIPYLTDTLTASAMKNGKKLTKSDVSTSSFPLMDNDYELNNVTSAVLIFTNQDLLSSGDTTTTYELNKLELTVLDTEYRTNDLWGLSRVHNRTLPIDSNHNYWTSTYKGKDQHVYILDTGVRGTHDEFRDQNGSSRIGNGNDLTGEGNPYFDGDGHGTHCAGTAAGLTVGIAKEATIHSVKVLDSSGSGTWSWIIQGMDWIAQQAQSLPAGERAVASASLGGGFNQAVNDAVNACVAAGVVFVAAAGNSNQDAATFSPASAFGAIAVGATDSSDNRASFSNYGTTVNIFAPGVSIRSSVSSGDSSYSSYSGTSMACPHVAGIAASWFSYDSTTTPAGVATKLADIAVPFVKNSLSPHNLLAQVAGHSKEYGGITYDSVVRNGVNYLKNPTIVTQSNYGITFTEECYQNKDRDFFKLESVPQGTELVINYATADTTYDSVVRLYSESYALISEWTVDKDLVMQETFTTTSTAIDYLVEVIHNPATSESYYDISFNTASSGGAPSNLKIENLRYLEKEPAVPTKLD